MSEPLREIALARCPQKESLCFGMACVCADCGEQFEGDNGLLELCRDLCCDHLDECCIGTQCLTRGVRGKREEK